MDLLPNFIKEYIQSQAHRMEHEQNYVVVKPYIFTKTIPPKSNLAIAKAETEVALMWQFILPSGTVVKSLSYSQTSRRNWGNTFTFKKRARERIKEAFEVILDESCTGFKEVRSWLPIQFYAHTNDTLNLKKLIDSNGPSRRRK